MTAQPKDSATSRPSQQLTPQNVGERLEQFRPRLRRMLDLRIDPRVRGRVDRSDVIQEAFIEAVDRLPSYLASPEVPFFVWVRFLTGQKLAQVHRKCLGNRQLQPSHEVPMEFGGAPAASSGMIADAFAATGTSPSGVAMRGESFARLKQALEDLKPLDREVLVLRHFEGMSLAEVAQVLEITANAACVRYWRAGRRLHDALEHGGESS